ncbi:hypothetical protein evm_014979 [Chilo suppressalis]|nr:hypothetical protein evm_014979 [Chilo suppressalis]
MNQVRNEPRNSPTTHLDVVSASLSGFAGVWHGPDALLRFFLWRCGFAIFLRDFFADNYALRFTLLGNWRRRNEFPCLRARYREYSHQERVQRSALQNIVDILREFTELSERLHTAGHGFRLAVKYYLPRLLVAPIAHVFLYHHYVLALLQIAPATDDRESFKQVECNLHPIKKLLIKALGNGPKIDATLRMAVRARRQLAIEKCNELARLVDNWDTSDTGQCCNEFIREDTLSKIGPGKRIAERRAYLFDGLLLLCKPVAGLVNAPINVPTAGAQAFPMDGIGRLIHDPSRGPSADCRVLMTADAAGTNG